MSHKRFLRYALILSHALVLSGCIATRGSLSESNTTVVRGKIVSGKEVSLSAYSLEKNESERSVCNFKKNLPLDTNKNKGADT